MHQKKLLIPKIKDASADALALVDPLSFATSLPTKEGVAQLAECFVLADGICAFLAYTGVGGLRFAGFLLARSVIDRPIAFCPISSDLVVGSAMWRVEVLRQINFARQIAADPTSELAPVIWLTTLNSGCRDAPPWLFSLACVPIEADWDGGLLYPVPFCPGRFERMARQPQARNWLETHSPDCSTARPTAIALTIREKQVLRCLCKGFSEKQVASALKISVNTVHVFVKLIYQKFGVESRSDLLSIFIDRVALDAIAGEE